jgi:hypothetical protein
LIKDANLKDKFIISICIASISIVFLGVAFVPVVYNTKHLADTLFLTSLGWRIYNGATPVLDFGHFYGGVIAQYIAWSYQLFGPTIKSLDYAFLMLWASAVWAAFVICYNRIGRLTFWLFLTIISVLMLTRAPLEGYAYITFLASADSFIYNRFATSLALIVIVYVQVPAKSHSMELIAGFLAGLLLVSIVLVKPTFAVMIPAALIALLMQKDLKYVLVCLIGGIIAIMIFDPNAQKVIGSYNYAVASVGGTVDPWGLIKKSVRLLLVQPLSTTFAIAALWISLKANNRGFTLNLLSAVILTGGGIGMAITMGGQYSLGQQAIPFLTIVPLVLYERARQTETPIPQQLRLLTLFLAAAFVLPHVVNTVLVSKEAINNRDLVLFRNGPLKGYLSTHDDFDLRNDKTGEIMPIDRLVQQAADFLDAGNQMNNGVQYIMLADGLHALEQIKDIDQYGIIADGKFAFDFALGAPPVLGYPVWQRKTSPELLPDVPIPEEVDIAILRKITGNPTETGLRAKLEVNFTLCQQTAIWDIFTRDASNISRCSYKPELGNK